MSKYYQIKYLKKNIYILDEHKKIFKSQNYENKLS